MVWTFRAKAVIGIALIEAVLLSLLIFSVLHFQKQSSDNQFNHRVSMISSVFASLIRHEVVAYDLAELKSAVDLLCKNPAVGFVRILDRQNRVMAEGGRPDLLHESFTPSADLHNVPDGIYRSVFPVLVEETNFGNVQIGYDVSEINKSYHSAQHWGVGIALFEMLLVALFSLVLGTYLTRQVRRFTTGAEEISAGHRGLQLPVVGNDEIAQATRAFNEMSRSIQVAHDSMERQIRERTQALEQTNHRLSHLLDDRSSMLESQSVGLVTLQERTIIWCNAKFVQMMGYANVQELIGKTTRVFYAHEEDFIAVGAAYREHGDLSMLNRDFEFRRQDGTSVWVDISGTRLPAEGQSLWVIVDVTDRVLSQQALERSERKFRALFESTSEAIMILDGDHFVDCNQSAIDMFGVAARDEFCRLKVEDLSPPFQPCGTESKTLAQQWIERSHTGSVRFEWHHLRLDTRQTFDAEVILSSVPIDGRELTLAVVWDVSERKAMMEKIRRQANFDHLTGMCNRRYFMDLAERELERARRYEKPLAVLGIDIDFFKRINDTYGHKAGDLALQKFAATCHEVVRQTDLVGRLGGEEFAVMLPDTPLERSREIAERLRKRVEESELHLPDGETVLRFTVSIGLVYLPASEHTDIDSLLQKADAALYGAKKSGRNRVVVA
jgi:diguanylate cyclase (GGDEF)-like protein/PAS domain S-box-containing protein